MKTSRFLNSFFSILFLLFFLGNIDAQVDSIPIDDGMNNKKMEAIFKSEAEEIKG